MRRLIIDTATEALSVALFSDGALMGHHHEIAGRGHAEKLMPVIASLDGGGRADEILVDNGPGSFTGVRIGLAAARALAFAWGAELSVYSSLSLLAAMAQQTEDSPSGDLAIVMTGGHGELFWQIFDRATLDPRAAPASTPIGNLAAQLDAPRLYGSGAQTLVDARGNGEAFPLHPDARLTPLLPASHLHIDTKPIYGRGADAIPIAGRKAQP